ncbi:MAG: methyltransferase domain-containing protein [candidate division Zixibacteria bacterium]|nr:methyltransferase domain-containing protein [Gammaproteobacteria bacterium]NIX54649.1 methyltransferase domain-containing protein [candidate division Zixibacteria bacterium]
MGYFNTSQKTVRRYNRLAPVYDFVEWFVEEAVFRSYREKLWSRIGPGKVLEVGVGTGKNIPYYSHNLEVTAIDISEGMMSFAKKRAEEVYMPVDLQMMDVQSLSFPDDTFDTAVATFVFCSVPMPVDGLRELKRVVKPEGDIWLLEHVRVSQPVIGWLMDILNPIIVRVMGANINRRTVENVKASGLKILEVEHLQGELVKLIHARPSESFL